MITKELADYIESQLSKNFSKEQIISVLKSAGWSEADINEGFAATSPVAPPVIPSLKPKLKITLDKILLWAMGAVLVALVVVGAYSYWNGAFASLPILTSEAMDNAKNSDTAFYDTTLAVDFSEIKNTGNSFSLFPADLSAGKLIVTAKGAYDAGDKDNTKGYMFLSVGLGSSPVEGEIRVLDKTIYGAITKAPSVGFLPVLASFENKWISFPYKSEDGQIADNPFSAFPAVDSSIVNKLTPEQEEHLYQLTRDANLIKMVKKLPVEEITGEKSYHFLFDLDKEGIIAYLQSAENYINSVGKNDSALSAFDATSFAKELDKFKDFQGEIWIGKKDKQLHKISVSFAVQPDETKEEQVKINVVSIWSGWNEPITVEAPAESVPFEKFISDLFNQSFYNVNNTDAEGYLLNDAFSFSSQSVGNEAQIKIKSQLSYFRAEGEIFWDVQMQGSYAGVCSSNAFVQGKGVIETAGGKFACRDSTNSYAVSSKLPDKSTYWCVDSTGFSNEVTSSLTSTSCPAR